MTKTRSIAVLVLLALAGCAQSPQDAARDVERSAYRAERFEACMKLLPSGPQSTTYNDWSEVVDSCESAAYYQMNTRFQ